MREPDAHGSEPRVFMWMRVPVMFHMEVNISLACVGGPACVCADGIMCARAQQFDIAGAQQPDERINK